MTTAASITVPAAGEVIARFRTYDDLVEAFRTVKDLLGLSNKVCDDLIGIADGRTDKALGPTRAKGLSAAMFDDFTELFAVEFEMKINLEAAQRMQSRWEGRDGKRVHSQGRRVSKRMIERAAPAVMSESGKLGAQKRMVMLSAEHRTEIARKAAKKRWKLHRKTMRERLRERKEAQTACRS
ncbi:MAG TPA: hypothetical protein VGH13_11640 [Xanthobacteraceae bacterium]